jgi:hypothetical protein
MWTPQEVKQRDMKLLEWLDSTATGEEAGRLAGQTYKEIAVVLAATFDKKVSSWSARLYVRQAWKKNSERKPELNRGGRPRDKANKQSKAGTISPSPLETVSDRRKDPRGRPPRIDRTPPAANLEADGLPDPFDIRMGIFRETMVLCGISASHLHRLIKNCPRLQWAVGSKSNLHAELAVHGITFKRIHFHVSPARIDLASALSLHQIILLGPSCLRIVLLACELRTFFINAAVFEVVPSRQIIEQYFKTLQPHIVRRGAVPRKFDPRWHAKLALAPPNAGTPLTAELPAEAIADFIQDTTDRIPMPIGAVILGKSLGDAEGLFNWFAERQPSRDFQVSPAPRHQYLPVQTVQDMPTEEFREYVAAILSEHNLTNAQPALSKQREEAERYKAEALARRHEGSPIHPPRTLTKRTDADVGEDILRLEKQRPKIRHRGTDQACRPIRLQGIWTSDN